MIPTTLLERIGQTPLVRLVHLAAGLPVPVYAKCEHLQPGGSVKDRIALAIVDDAEQRGLLRPGATLVEATAGNTGIGLALVAAARSYKVVCVLPEKMSVDKRQALAALGVQVIVTANAPPSDPRNFVNTAKRLADENGWFLTEQFSNPANPRIHETTTGPEVFTQCGGVVGAFVGGGGDWWNTDRRSPLLEATPAARAHRAGRPRGQPPRPHGGPPPSRPRRSLGSASD